MERVRVTVEGTEYMARFSWESRVVILYCQGAEAGRGVLTDDGFIIDCPVEFPESVFDALEDAIEAA